MAAYTRFFTYLTLLSVTFSVAYATDPTQLQDFCNPIMAVTADDFFFANGLDKSGDTSNRLGSAVTPVGAAQLPGLNTLGISMARLDFAPYGLIAPHIHPRATEVLTVLEGTIYVGFVTSNQPDNKLFAKVLKKGDVFVFPQGLIHFQLNVGKTPAFAISALSSQNPGVVTVGNAVFGAQPPISIDVLSKAFQLDANVVKLLQSKFSTSA
ncbi:putative germin-like protein 2-1 [Bienertia sinuspersici]